MFILLNFRKKNYDFDSCAALLHMTGQEFRGALVDIIEKNIDYIKTFQKPQPFCGIK
jgi:hypothetical protein